MMNRVIKFRAWDGREFINDYYNQINYIAINGGALVAVQYDDVCPEGVVYAEPERVTLMQFTGLHDKNGVEIYEGDIVQDHIGTGVVEWHSAAFKVNYRDGWAKWFYDYTLKGELESIEVMGNIYQNPELLK
jgi:uncharacterized phage protein (TIGR01671 family)